MILLIQMGKIQQSLRALSGQQAGYKSVSPSFQKRCCAASLEEKKGCYILFLLAPNQKKKKYIFFFKKRKKFLPPLFSLNESIAKICIQKHLTICTAVHLAIILQEKAFVLANCHRLGITERNRKHLNVQKKKDIPAFYQLP